MSSHGTVVELVDTPDLKSVEHLARAGSSPARPTGTLCALSNYTINIMRNFKINSTAISDLSVDGDQVNIQFTSSDKQYTFRAADPSGFIASLEQVIADPEGSVGSYIHRARKSEALVEV